MRLHPEVEDLLNGMRELERFLATHGEAFWSKNIKQAADEVEKSDAHGLGRFLRMFGGMGSLNDVVLHRDGQPLKAENDQLDLMRSRAWTMADRLRHEVR